MAVIIPHPTEELRLYELQKELIKDLYEEGRIMNAAFPFWIEAPAIDLNNKKAISKVELKEIQIEEKCIYYPVTVDYDGKIIETSLPLIFLHRGKNFSDKDKKIVIEKKQPVNQLKIFRLGLVQDQGPHAKSISKSVWCKLHYSAATVE